MTTVTFHSADGRLDGFVVEGHSGYAQAGADIVCAAVSAAVGLTECTINQTLMVAQFMFIYLQEIIFPYLFGPFIIW